MSKSIKKKKFKINLDYGQLIKDIKIRKILVLSSKEEVTPFDAITFGILNIIKCFQNNEIFEYRRYQGEKELKIVVVIEVQLLKIIIHQLLRRKKYEKRKIS